MELMEGEEREKELRKRVAQLEDPVEVATFIPSSEVSENASQASTQLTAALDSCQSEDKLSEQLAAVRSISGPEIWN